MAKVFMWCVWSQICSTHSTDFSHSGNFVVAKTLNRKFAPVNCILGIFVLMNLESPDELGRGNPLIQSSESSGGQKVLGRGAQPRCLAGKGSQPWLMDLQTWKQVLCGPKGIQASKRHHRRLLLTGDPAKPSVLGEEENCLNCKRLVRKRFPMPTDLVKSSRKEAHKPGHLLSCVAFNGCCHARLQEQWRRPQ